MVKRDIIVIGASAGGLQALSALLSKLPKDLQASVFVVWHISPNHRSILPGVLSRAGKLPATHAVDAEPIRPGRIYVARPAYHLVLEVDRVRLTKGPKRKSVSSGRRYPVRLSAYAFGPRVIGVVLTGALDEAPPGSGRSRIAAASLSFRTRRRLRIRRCRRAPSSTLKSITDSADCRDSDPFDWSASCRNRRVSRIKIVRNRNSDCIRRQSAEGRHNEPGRSISFHLS